MSCGVSVNLSAIESSITAHVGKITGIAGMAGLPFVTAGLIAGMAVSNGNYLGAINIVMNTSGMLDTAWNSMRTGFDKLVADGVNAGTSVLSDDYLESIGIRATGNLAAPLEKLSNNANLLNPGDLSLIHI